MSSPITWRNVGSNNNGAANRLIVDGLDTVGDAFGGIKTALRDVQADRQAVYDNAVDTNTQRFLDTVASYRDVNALNEADQAGVFKELLSGFGNTVDRERTRDAVATQLAALQGRKTDEIAYNTALDSEQNRLLAQEEAPVIRGIEASLANNDFAGARAAVNGSNLRDKASLLDRIEAQERGESQYQRDVTRQGFEDNRLQGIRDLINSNRSTATDFNTGAQSIFDRAGVTKEQYVSGSLPAEQYADIRAQLANLPRPMTEEELIQRTRQATLNAPGARIEDLGQLDGVIRDAMNDGLSERQALEVQTQVDAYARANGIDSLSNNIFSTENQERLGGMSYAEGGSIIDQAFSEEDLEDWDYSQWKDDLINAAINGIEISSGKKGETVRIKVPPSILVDSLKATRGSPIETDNQFKNAIVDKLTEIGALDMYKQAKDLEAKSREFTAAAKAKANRNNPLYSANALYRELNTARARQEVPTIPTPDVPEEVVPVDGDSPEEIRRKAKLLLENVRVN